RILAEEPHRHVERSATPAFHREELRRQAGVVRSDRRQIDRAHARRQQRLMRVTHRGVREQHPLLLQHPLRECLRTQLIELLLGAHWRRRGNDARELGKLEALRARATPRLRVAVDDGVGQERENTGRPIPLAWPTEELWRLVYESSRVVA